MTAVSHPPRPHPGPTLPGSLASGPQVVTFGCRLNTYESEVIRDHARAAGLDDAIIVNTCAVTAEAERQARQTIRRLRRDNPAAEIIVTGCAAELDPGKYAGMPEVSRVLGNAAKMRRSSYGLEETSEDIGGLPHPSLPTTGFENRARALVQVQHGCDHRCTFCIIPFARGPNRSVAVGPIVEEVRRLTALGFNEVILTGVDITAWGQDLPGTPTLGQMVRRVLALVPELPRLRLSSLDPVEVDADLLDVLASDERLLPHLHLSVQAGSDMILKRMKRRHLRADVIALAAEIRRRRPEVTLGADFIAGFPTETDAMFEDTLALVAEAGLTHLHVFGYSARPGTPAAKMPALPGPVIRERVARLRATGDAMMAAALTRLVGTTASMLFEGPQTGHQEHYMPVRVTTPPQPYGCVRRVRVTAATPTELTGDVIP